jgi:NTP pyrophosphatase (non-canonical NTP hydrolase)
MTFNEYQEQSSLTAVYLDKIIEKHPDMPKWVADVTSLAYVSNGLGEVGEIQGKIKKIIRDKGGEWTEKDSEEIAKEIGDCLWYLARLCDIFDINFDDCADKNIAKLYSRMERGKITGSGDNR